MHIDISMKNNATVLVTGATGFVGSHLARRLVQEGYDVHAIFRKSSNTWRITDILPRLSIHYGDITEREKLMALTKKVKPKNIFHLANIGIYGGVEGKIEDVISVNLLGTINLIDACSQIEYNAFVNTGSSSEYGPKNKIMNEDDLAQPQSVYAIAKLAGTNYALKEALLSTRPITTLRLFSPYGPFDEKKRLIPYAINRMIDNREIILQSKKNVRDYIYIDDVIDAYVAAAAYIRLAKGKVINIGNGKQLSVKEVAETLKKVTHSKSKIIWGKQSANRFESSVWKASITRAKQYLHWRPKYSFAKGAEATINWYLANKNQTD